MTQAEELSKGQTPEDLETPNRPLISHARKVGRGVLGIVEDANSIMLHSATGGKYGMNAVQARQKRHQIARVHSDSPTEHR